MRYALLTIFLLLACVVLAQRDSCNCVSITPYPDFLFTGRAFAVYTKIGDKKPLNGICHSYYMKVAYVLPDYERTYKYGIFKNGELQLFIQYNDKGDTTAYFHRIDKDSVVAETKRYNYQTGVLEWREICYYSGKDKLLKVYGYSKQGFVNSEANYFYPRKGDSLNYYGNNFINYKKDAQLTSDGFYSTPVQEGPYFEYGGKNGEIITVKGAYHNNYKSGKWTTSYDSGKLKSEGSYSQYNWKDGKWKEWYEDGQIQSDIDYCNSNFCGKYQEWYANGQLKIQRSYKDYKQDGIFTEYWENGKLKKRDTYAAGKILQMESWYENGQQASSYQYSIAGRPVGAHKEWFEHGIIKKEVNYKDGMHDGPEKEYYINGVVMHEVEYTDNQRSAERWYYETGQLKSDEKYNRYQRNGLSTYYFRSGKVWRQENYLNGQKDGPAVTFNNQGVLLEDLNFHFGRWNGECKWYYPNGKLGKYGNYTDGIRNGDYKEYDQSGILIYEQSYKMGKPLNTNRPKYFFVGHELDSLRDAYKKDVDVIARGWINAPESGVHDLTASEELKNKIRSDLICISKAVSPPVDSIKFVHCDTSLHRVYVRLEYPNNREKGRPDSTPWPKQFDKYITDLHLVPVKGDYYSDGGDGIRQGFTSDIYFSGRVLDSLLKKMNPKFGCDYYSLIYGFDNRAVSGVVMHINDQYTDYYYRYYPPHENNYSYMGMSWSFRIYPDGSVDLIDSGPVYYEFRIPY